jgi:thiol-disulfide isomerase/thioredoxin
MKTLILSATALLLFAAGAAARPLGDGLGVGMKAPALDHVNWLKGDKIAAWEPGQVYVLDFWATWCGPCKASIPHVNEMAKSHKDKGVHVIGVAIWPRQGMVPTDQFVTDKGDAMDYLIAEDVEGATAKTFMEASANFGIPTMMIIDGKGEIAWIGHPMAVGDTLDQVLAGTDDRAAAVAADADRRAKSEQEMAGMREQSEVAAAIKGYDKLDAAKAAELLKVCEKQLASQPNNPQLAYNKYMMLAKIGPKETASAYGKSIVEGVLKDNPQGLNLVAWGIVDPKLKTPREQRDLDLALKAAMRADELTKHGDASIIDTVARVHFWKGEIDKAIELQKQAVAVAENDEQKGEIEATLAEYEKAKAGA